MMRDDPFEAVHLKNVSKKLTVILESKKMRTRWPTREEKETKEGILSSFFKWLKRESEEKIWA